MIGKESVWHPANGIFLSTVPAPLKSWLVDSTSLTQRLIDASAGDFRVRVLKQGWEKPLISEAQKLGISSQQLAFVRHVHLICRDQVWVYARTVIPNVVAKGRLRQLTRLGSRPLGAVLFANPKVVRGNLEICRVSTDCAIHRIATSSSSKVIEAIWGRRSVFNLYNCSLLVNEFFLPTIIGKA